MKTYWRILKFAKPIEKYAIPYFFYTLFHAFFNTFNFILVIPILNILFDKDSMVEAVTVMPDFSFSSGYVRDMLNFMLYKMYGGNYNVMEVLLLVALFLVTSSLLSSLFRYLGQRTVENMRIRTLCRIRNNVFDNLMTLNVGYFSNEKKGDIISKISSDVEVIRYCISSTLHVAFREPFLILGYMLALLSISWELTAFAAVFLPLVALTIGTIVKKLKRKATAGQQKFAEMVSTLDESLSGIKVIKAYNASDFFREKFYAINNRYSRIMRSMAKRQQLSSPLSEFMGIVALSVLLMFGGSLVLKGSLSGSAFIVYLGIFSQITRPVRSFADAFSNINQGLAAGERVLELLDAKSTITDKPDAVQLSEFRDRIEFHDVHFSYDNKEVIHGISFTVKKGQTVALVGPSGGGKSTLSDLIPRFYDVASGSITVDGVDVRDISLYSLNELIGVVSQETVLFNDTIENNIRMGNTEAPIEAVSAAAKVANAHDFILETENGYQTNIGDRGMKLSGGQRQRLSIARAVLENPAVLILDEATSALDTESEKLVQDALQTLLEGRTSIVIAHRLSTVYNADQIIVIENGRIAEQGTHEELIAQEGLYSKLVEMQHMS